MNCGAPTSSSPKLRRRSAIQKSELAIRPVWHQSADRVQAHILVCFLAYVLWKTLEQWQRRAGLGNSPRTILEELKRIQSTDVVLPTEDGRARSGCAASCGRMPPKLPFLIASGSNCPSA